MTSAHVCLQTDDGTFRKIDKMTARVDLFGTKSFLQEKQERERRRPNFGQTDNDVFKNLVTMIAFSQQAPSDRVKMLMNTPVFSTMFLGYSVEKSAGLSPDKLIGECWQEVRVIRFPKKIEAMVRCAQCLHNIQKQYGSFMAYLETIGLPKMLTSEADIDRFWNAFEQIRTNFQSCNFPFFRNFTSLCHLFLDFGFDCAKPDSAVMSAAVKLGIVPQPPTATESGNSRPHPGKDLKAAVRTIQEYSVSRGMRVPVVDLYFLIHGRQREASQLVRPEYYS